MLKVVLILAGCLGVAVAAILVYAATKPDTFRVARSASIKAPPDKNFPADQRFPRLDQVVALREQGPADEADLWRQQ